MKVPILDHTVAEIDSAVRTWIDSVTRVLNSISFGPGINSSEDRNLDGIWLTGVTNAAVDTETIYNHNLGRIPIGYLVFSIDKGGVIYKGTTAWSKTQISFKCSVVVSANFLVFLI